MEVADYRRMNTFELIDRINETASWDDEENEYCMRELCDRYNIDFDAFFNHEGIFDRTCEDIWDQIIKAVYNDVVVHHQYAIDNHDYTIVSLESDTYSEFAVIDDVYEKIMFDVYFIGTMRECKEYIKECVDNDD